MIINLFLSFLPTASDGKLQLNIEYFSDVGCVTSTGTYISGTYSKTYVSNNMDEYPPGTSIDADYGQFATLSSATTLHMPKLNGYIQKYV
jgi:hypothetical protein